MVSIGLHGLSALYVTLTGRGLSRCTCTSRGPSARFEGERAWWALIDTLVAVATERPRVDRFAEGTL